MLLVERQGARVLSTVKKDRWGSLPEEAYRYIVELEEKLELALGGDDVGSTPTFSKRHYEKVAEQLKDMWQWSHTDSTTLKELAYNLADMFAKDNQMFDRGKFYTACGIEL